MPTHEFDRETGLHALGYWLQEHAFLTPNALNVLRFIKSDRFQSLEHLAEAIDRGDAQETEAEYDLMYDNWGELVETVIDLYNMVRRREEHMAAFHKEIIERSIATGRGE